MAEKFPYEDIINIPYHISKKYPRPSMDDRAARFAPFAAITGYEEMVLEEARETTERRELDESALYLLGEKLNLISELLDKKPQITVTYFKSDSRKSGGSYVSVTGTISEIDEYKRLLILSDGAKICIDDVYGIESDLFSSPDWE